MAGQIGFGFAADVLGLRKMYGLEPRAIMGIGIRADCPLSAVITTEFAPRKHCARMLSWVFSTQPVGQLLANVLSLAAVEAYKPWVVKNARSCQFDDLECFRAIDRLWRLVVGIGIVPALIALVFRFTIPESPRYTLNILKNIKGTLEDTANFFGAPGTNPECGEVELLHVPATPEIQRPASRHSTSSSVIVPDEEMESDIYGLGISSPEIVSHIWQGDSKNGPSVYQTLRDDSKHTLLMASIGTVVGGLLVIKTVNHIAFKLGPNAMTFTIPAETFPTKYRCTCHGIAAASGKLGPWVVQILLAYAFQSDKPKPQDDFEWERQNFGHILQVMSAFVVAGAVTTYFLVPEIRDHDDKSRTLEVLACGKKAIDELNRQRMKDDEED
ncbi:hypothetical protein G6011_01779 [Alternaria panax]|uniref:Uncharacterized protein n=1 Tax=Alternaria panax TaxID=48097 RepID=A0AAD4NW40_9PLEO|nr:hypothetical protein G6011_01779 [Alternaria panax]